MSEPTPVPGEKPGNVRWIICALLFFSVAVNYIDRLVIGILKQPLSRELGWSEADYGQIAAAFSFAYAFGYLLGGRFIDRLGVKRGLPVFVFLWSLSAMAHGLCSHLDLTKQFRVSYPWFSLAEGGFGLATLVMPMTAAGFMLARIALGLTEGANFPAAIKVVAEWFPVKERALATGWFNSPTNVGAILCPVAVPWIYSHIGWAWTFYLTGGTGFVWLIGWWLFYDEPDFTGGFVNGFTGLIIQKTGSYIWVFAYFSMMYLLSLAFLQLLVPRIQPAKPLPPAPQLQTES
jgi:ACS family hexuronate transporter-like MFS transporter